MNLKKVLRFTCSTSIGFLFLALLPSFTAGQNYLFDIQHFDERNGLSSTTMYNIGQDPEGFLWLGSASGLHKFNGYSLQTWHNETLDLQDPMVCFFAFGSQHRVWYSNRANTSASDFGGVLDTKTGEVLSAKEISGGRFGLADIELVSNPSPDKQDVLIATHSGTFYKLSGDSTTAGIEEVITLEEPLWMSQFCVEAEAGGYWIVNHGQLLRVKDQEILAAYDIPIHPQERLASMKKWNGSLVLEISRRGQDRFFTLKGNEVVPFTVPGSTPSNLERLLFINEEYACFTTPDSLLIKSQLGKSLLGYARSELLNGIGLSLIFRSFSDQQGNLWVATYKGLVKIRIRKNPFSILYSGSDPRIYKKEGEPLWSQIPTVDSIINPPQDRDNPYYAFSYFEDEQGLIWSGDIKPRIKVYDPQKSTLTFYPLEGEEWVERIYQNPATHHFWVATNNGLYLLEENQQGYQLGERLLPELEKRINVRQFYTNEAGIWVVTSQGLFLLDSKTEKVLSHCSPENGLPDGDLAWIHEDEAGIFWMANMRDGLIRWDRAQEEYQHFTMADGLSDNILYAVYEDENQNLWLPSNWGLMAFNKNTHQTRLFLPQHGIAQEIIGSSHCKGEDGRLYFGGKKGVTSFQPEEVLKSIPIEASPPLQLTHVQVMQEGQEDFIDITGQFREENQVRLTPMDRFMEVEVAFLDFEDIAENHYAYKLTKNQEQWIYTFENTFSLLNLPYGEYSLLVKARGPSGSWSETPLEIPIFVQKPLYMRTWFILTALALVLALAIVVVRLRIRALKKDKERLELEVRKRTETIEQDKAVISQQADELREMDEVKSRFFANITHEIRTPLTLVIGPVEQEMKKALPASSIQNLKGIHRNAKNLLGLVNQLLDLSKLESKRMTLEIARGEIVDYTRDLVTQFKPLAVQKHVNLTFSSIPKTWETHFDTDKWNKTVYNLLSNAIKFTPATGRVEVALNRQQTGDQEFIELSVKDTGPGIPADQLPRIFNRFYQVNDSATRTQGGTGIGLALVKELVELQEGEISVHSAVGEGTSFTVKLPVFPLTGLVPLQQVVPAPAPYLPQPLPLISTPGEYLSIPVSTINPQLGSGNKLNLLLIEDNQELRKYIRSCIDETRYEITEAADGKRGLEIALERVPDLIISDVMMPKMDGFEVTRALRSHLATSHIPLILLTAKASLESKLEGLKRGADAYLTKPFSPEELALRIDKLIELRKALQARYSNLDFKPKTQEVVPSQPEDDFVLDLRSFIDENLGNEGLTTEAIGKHFGLSRSQLYRKVQSLTDITIGELVRGRRCEMALSLIKKGELSLSEIAYETGFNSPSYFSRAFKKHYGKAPSEMVQHA